MGLLELKAKKKTAAGEKRPRGLRPEGREGGDATNETLNATAPPRASCRLSGDALEEAAPDVLDEDQRELFEERAAIMEIDGGLPRHKARARAWKDLFGKKVEP